MEGIAGPDPKNDIAGTVKPTILTHPPPDRQQHLPPGTLPLAGLQQNLLHRRRLVG